MFTCKNSNNTFASNYSLNRHIETYHSSKFDIKDSNMVFYKDNCISRVNNSDKDDTTGVQIILVRAKYAKVDILYLI